MFLCNVSHGFLPNSCNLYLPDQELPMSGKYKLVSLTFNIKQSLLLYLKKKKKKKKSQPFTPMDACIKLN